MTSQWWMLTVCISLASVLGTGDSLTTMETQKYTCRTFGSGVVKPYNGSHFYVSSNCPFTFTRFTHNRVDCDITVRRGESGLLVHVEIIINKVRTVLHNGGVFVESHSVSLPYDHTYQHIFSYGIYVRLRSALLPLSVTWHAVPGGVDTLWVELDQELTSDMTGLCGKHCVSGDKEQLIKESVFDEDSCQIRDPITAQNKLCSTFFSYTLGCLQAQTPHYMQLCEWNIHGYENSQYIGCAFYKEVALQCGSRSHVWNIWRTLIGCAPPSCSGDLVYAEQGAAFVPTCSNLNPRPSGQDFVSSCVCPDDKVLNDHGDGSQCVRASSCPCVFAGRSYLTGDIRSTKCQSCLCQGGKWRCSENLCPPRCLIEGQFVTTFDGKQYVIPGRCTYVASRQGGSWMIQIEFSGKGASLKTVTFQLLWETFTFTRNKALIGDQEITEFYRSDHALVFWQSSMYLQFHTSFGLKIQVQVFPEVQLYITPPVNHTGPLSGLCGNNNGDTTDDFTTSSGIIENSAQACALSWSVGPCSKNIPPTCMNTDNEIFADEKCSVLTNSAGVFAECHQHIPADRYHTACIQRTCNCAGNLQRCLCVALESYAKACTSLGVPVSDWRTATNCTLNCPRNLEFAYQTLACNHTCRSLSGPDPRCGLGDDPVEGCGCPAGTHLNEGQICTPKADCVCHHHGGTTPPGPVVMDGRQCICRNGVLRCSKDCGCSKGRVCFHCSEYPVNTDLKTCDSLSKPLGANMTCVSGCYCPHGQYEDHLGNCVLRDNCTCVYSGIVFRSGQRVKTSCKTCVCGQGQWHCTDEPCPGTCQVYGNGHYQTFDSKWYRFDGHCEYTLVEDYCGKTSGSFSVRVESVPCCDEALTCSRSIVLDLQGECTLTLSDMRVTRQIHAGWALQQEPLYTVHNVGLYIIISVPSRGLTLIWDKHTRITIQLHPRWRNKVCGLCGNFDSNEMNDLQTAGSAAVSSPMAFGNSWKADSAPCSDVTAEVFPCERSSYCSAWAQRRCMMITGDTFKDCHLKVDPEPYYHACVQESCSCEFEGKFLGFCTAVAAYAEACSDQDVCVNWRTPDLCPVYCDYYNERGQCSWHYEACGKVMTCSRANDLTHKLEGCYPRCPKERPYYDENTEECTTLRNCTCYFNDTFVEPRTVVNISSTECHCQNGIIHCRISPKTPTLTPPSSPTAPPPTTTPTTILSTTTQRTTAETTTERTTYPTLVPTTIPSTTIKTTELPTTTTQMTTNATTTTVETTPSTTIATTELPTTTTEMTTNATTTTVETTPSTTIATTELPTTTTEMTTNATTVTTVETTPLTTIATTELPTTTTPMTTTATSTTSATTSLSPTTETRSTEQSSTASLSTSKSWSTLISTVSTPSTLITTEMPTTWPNTTTTTTSTSTPTTTTELTPTTSNGTASTQVPSTTPSTTTTTTAPTTTAETWPTSAHVTSTPVTLSPNASATTENWSTTPTVIASSTETHATSPSTTSTTTPEPTETLVSTTATHPTVQTEPTSTPTTPVTSSQRVLTTEISTTQPPTATPPVTMTEFTNATSAVSTTESTTKECICKDLKRKQSWACGDTWTEDCFIKSCTDRTIQLTPVECPEPKVPTCPRGLATMVSDGCCETWKCDCQCELYGDPHYISFQGVTFDFLDECTYTLVEERSPRHDLNIAVDNFFCVPGLDGSCAKGVIVRYHNNVATLSIIPHLFTVQATLNNVIIQPPYEELGFRFETTGYIVSVYLPEIRSHVSLTPSYTLVVNLAMEHFLNNTQGQCGVCGGPSCVRKSGQIEDDDCCDKTSYDWVVPDPSKPACAAAPTDVPCVSGPTSVPPTTPSSPPPCPPNPLCDLLHHPVFRNCSRIVDLNLKKKNCEFDSCRYPNTSCSSLEQAAEECKTVGFCIDWRKLTNGSCNVTCPEGLVYRDCRDKLDDFCYGGRSYPGATLDKGIEGCFCPHGLLRAGNHSNDCVSECPCCKGPEGEPKWPGDVWESNCMLCTCNNRTQTEECVPKHPAPTPVCPPGAVLVNTSCCGDQICVEKYCQYRGRTHEVGDRWRDAAHPCRSFSCSTDGIQTETTVCPNESCPEENRIWDDQHCCFTCNNTCLPKMSNISFTVENCTTVIEMPVCQGHCESQPRMVLYGDLQIEQDSECCRQQASERRSVTLLCHDQTTRQYTYKHTTACECRACKIWR